MVGKFQEDWRSQFANTVGKLRQYTWSAGIRLHDGTVFISNLQMVLQIYYRTEHYRVTFSRLWMKFGCVTCDENIWQSWELNGLWGAWENLAIMESVLLNKHRSALQETEDFPSIYLGFLGVVKLNKFRSEYKRKLWVKRVIIDNCLEPSFNSECF